MHVTCSSYFNVFILVSRLVSYQSDAETAKIKKKKRAALVEERYMSGVGLLMGRDWTLGDQRISVYKVSTKNIHPFHYKQIICEIMHFFNVRFFL